jgi:GTPase
MDWRSPLNTKVQIFQNALLVSIYESSADKAFAQECLDELERLCETFGLQVTIKLASPLKKPDAGTFFGKGKVEEIAARVAEEKIDCVIIDEEITAQQQKNLEKALKCHVIDRTELILDVFAQRAQTKEARLQVELAKVKYQFPRLKRMWTHLSRQVAGGGGFLKGAGEQQIEIDRRSLRKRIDRLEKEIQEVSDQRQVQRQRRQRTAIPTFAIVGYTNAGKSTLLNALTDAGVLAEDKLFATLDTTTRKFILPNRQEILLIDTVGFIRKIPTALVAAFKSTLEEALYTDILLHLIDVSHPMAEFQAETTYAVLKELGAAHLPIINICNKMDQCSDPSIIQRLRIRYPKTVAISAKERTGLEQLLEFMIREISALRLRMKLRIPQSHYALVSYLMQEGKVFFMRYEGNDILLDIEIPKQLEHKVTPFLFNFEVEHAQSS